MGKFLGFIALVIVVVVLLLGGVLWFQAPWLLSNLLSTRYGAPVKVEGITVTSSSITLKGFRIENWEGGQVPNAFAAQEIRLSVKPWDLFKEEVYIEKIDIRGATLGIELYDTKGQDNNWVRLLQRMDHGKSREGRESRKRFFVETVQVDRLHIQLYSYPLKSFVDVEPIENLVMTEVDPDKPLAIGPITAAVYRAMLAKIQAQALVPKVIKGVLEAPMQVLEGFLRIFGGRPEPKSVQ